MQSLAASLAPAAATPCRVQRASSRRPFTTQRLQQLRWQHVARAEGEGSSEKAQPAQEAQQPPSPQQQEEEPVWVRRERERQLQKQEGGSRDLPFGLYLLFSSFTAIAAIGSIFEYTGQRAILDIIQPDSPLYAPILGFFAITGLPTAGFLFYKSVQAANKEAERMDKLDGY